jgi:hypothetical protein
MEAMYAGGDLNPPLGFYFPLFSTSFAREFPSGWQSVERSGIKTVVFLSSNYIQVFMVGNCLPFHGDLKNPSVSGLEFRALFNCGFEADRPGAAQTLAAHPRQSIPGRRLLTSGRWIMAVKIDTRKTARTALGPRRGQKSHPSHKRRVSAPRLENCFLCLGQVGIAGERLNALVGAAQDFPLRSNGQPAAI